VIECPLADLAQWGQAAYERVGMSPADATVVVDAQLEADRRGVDTHGFQRLPWYVDRLLAGENNPTPALRIVESWDAGLVLDGDAGLGQLVCTRLMEHALGRARASGVCVAVARRSNDWGCGARYPLMAARAGFVAFCTTTSVPTLAPYGTRTRMTGNNPMAFALPRRDAPPIVLDMALTPVALGKVMRARAEGQPVSLEWGFLDRDGRATTDPTAALTGVIPAIGGYKGTGLSLMMNALAGILSGSAHSSAVANEGGKRGQFFLVLDPGRFGPRLAFLDGVEAMAAEVKAAEPLPGSPGAFLPGEIEQQREDAAVIRGTVRYPPSVIAGLRDVGARIGLDWPWPH
jgi:LDH2 family malate/lactate/ureidoglycolate dehydrogenase